MNISVRQLVASEDPLSEEAISFLLAYSEEDENVDYKRTFDYREEKSWLELTKDVAALANTTGGYLVFGVENSSKDIVGLDEDVTLILSDVNNVQQKINRHLEPHLTALRTKTVKVQEKTAVLLYVPSSAARTHVISKDGEIKHPSGQTKTILRRGHVFVRRSGTNALADSNDLEAIFSRRMQTYRESLLSNIARVIEAPTTSGVFILERDLSDREGKRFTISDAPDGIPIGGMSFTIAPSTADEEIAAWVALSAGRPDIIPLNSCSEISIS